MTSDRSEPSCAIGVETAAQRENDFFHFNPNAEEFRPQGHVLLNGLRSLRTFTIYGTCMRSPGKANLELLIS